MIGKLSHIGLVVEDIDQTLAALCGILGRPVPPVEEIPHRKARMAQLWFGDISFEFVQDDSGTGFLARHATEKGFGLHHFCVVSDDLDGDIEALKSRGVKMLHEQPIVGVRGKRIAYLDASELNGINLELSEP